MQLFYQLLKLVDADPSFFFVLRTRDYGVVMCEKDIRTELNEILLRFRTASQTVCERDLRGYFSFLTPCSW